MDLAETLTQLTALPVADRLRVMETLWLSLDAEPEQLLSPEQAAELARRVAAYESNPDELLSREELFEFLRERDE